MRPPRAPGSVAPPRGCVGCSARWRAARRWSGRSPRSGPGRAFRLPERCPSARRRRHPCGGRATRPASGNALLRVSRAHRRGTRDRSDPRHSVYRANVSTVSPFGDDFAFGLTRPGASYVLRPMSPLPLRVPTLAAHGCRVRNNDLEVARGHRCADDRSHREARDRGRRSDRHRSCQCLGAGRGRCRGGHALAARRAPRLRSSSESARISTGRSTSPGPRTSRESSANWRQWARWTSQSSAPP